MEIVYCDACGQRISSNAVTSAIMADGKVLCEKCRPAAARPTVQRRSSGNAHPVVVAPAEAEPAPQRPAKKTGTLPRTTANEKTVARPSEAQSQNGMLIGVGLAGGCVALLGLFFMFSGNGSDKKPRAAPATPATAPTDSKTDRPNSAALDSGASRAPAEKSPAISPTLAPAPTAVPAATSALENRRTDLPESKMAMSGMLGNPTAKSDPDAVADAAYDKVLAAITKEAPAGKIKGLEDFLKSVDANAMAAARARTMLSTLKKATDVAKAPPPAPAPTSAPAAPVVNASPNPAATASNASVTPAPSNTGGAGASGTTSFKEDFETTAYGINFGKLTSELPGGRTGKGMKMLGGDNDRRGGIYAYAYPDTSQTFKTNTLALTSEGMKLKLKYHFTQFGFEVVLSFLPPGAKAESWARLRPQKMTKGAWSELELPLADFKVEGGAPIPPNSRIQRLEFWGYGAGESYLDDIELVP